MLDTGKVLHICFAARMDFSDMQANNDFKIILLLYEKKKKMVPKAIFNNKSKLNFMSTL